VRLKCDVFATNIWSPLVRCPWGCSDYFHKCGVLSYDVVARKIYGSAVTLMSGGDQYARMSCSKMEGMACDYTDVARAPCLLGNKDWKVVPSIAFVDGMPRVLSCCNHREGSNGKCFYPPRNPHGVTNDLVRFQAIDALRENNKYTTGGRRGRGRNYPLSIGSDHASSKTTA